MHTETPRPALPMGTLVLLTALPVITLNMFLPSLPSMTRDLQASESQMALAVSGYMVVAALLQLVIGPISDRIGRRPVLLTAFGLFTLASIGCVLAPEATLFLGLRMAQAGVVAGTVLAAAVVRDVLPAREAAGKMGAVAASMALAPVLGPSVGGILDQFVSWRLIFALYAGLGALALALIWWKLPETRRRDAKPPRLSEYRALVSTPGYWAYVLCMAFSVGSFYVVTAGVPFVTHALWDLSPALTGIGLGFSSLGFLAGGVITARLAPRLGIQPLILAGRVIPFCVLAAGIAVFLLGLATPVLLFGFTIFVGFGNGLTIANANAGALSIRPELAGTAASFGGAFSVAAGAALTWSALSVMAVSATPVALLAVILAVVAVSLLAGLAAVRLDRQPA